MRISKLKWVSEPQPSATQATKPTKHTQPTQATQAPSLNWVMRHRQETSLTLGEASNLLDTIISATNSYKLKEDKHCYFLKGITMVVSVKDLSNSKFYTLVIPLTEWFSNCGLRELEKLEYLSQHWVLASAPQATQVPQVPHHTHHPHTSSNYPPHLTIGYVTQRLLEAPYNKLIYRLEPETSNSLITPLGEVKCNVKWVSEPPLSQAPQPTQPPQPPTAPQPPTDNWVIKTGKDLSYVEMGMNDFYFESWSQAGTRIRVRKVKRPLIISFKLIGYLNPLAPNPLTLSTQHPLLPEIDISTL